MKFIIFALFILDIFICSAQSENERSNYKPSIETYNEDYDNYADINEFIPQDVFFIKWKKYSNKIFRIVTKEPIDSALRLKSNTALYRFFYSQGVVNGFNFEQVQSDDSIYTKDNGWIPFPKRSMEECTKDCIETNQEVYFLGEARLSPNFRSLLFQDGSDFSICGGVGRDLYLFNCDMKMKILSVVRVGWGIVGESRFEFICKKKKSGEMVVFEKGDRRKVAFRFRLNENGKVEMLYFVRSGL